MKIIKKLLFILILLILSNLSYAEPVTFESYLITTEMSPNNVHETIEIISNFKEKQNSINFSLTPRIKNLVVFLDEQKIECTIKEIIGTSVINCQFPDYISGKHSLEIEFSSNYPLIPVEDKLMFKSDYNPVIETNKFTYILKLPMGYIIPEERLITPKPNKIYSDGKRIILLWGKDKLSERFEVSVLSKSVTPTFNFVYMIIALVILSFLTFILFYFKKRKKKEIVIPGLLESEKLVVKALKKAKNNELWQKQLQIKTGLSKVKLSRTLRNLEMRDIIKKEPYGNTNKIRLVWKEKQY